MEEAKAKKKPKSNITWQQQLRDDEAWYMLSVIDATEGRARCADCKGDGLCFLVHMFKELGRPIIMLCRACTVKRAGGEEKVYVREAIGPWLRKFWKANKWEAKRVLSTEHKEALQKARAASRSKAG